MSDDGKALLEGAYALSSPDDNISYYKKFAGHYDRIFVADMGFYLPQAVAQAYEALSSDTDTPIADLGCGTGVIAERLTDTTIIDGLDISPDMLAVAATKKRYRNLIQIDLTKPGPDMPSGYGAVLSSGTFTHGHLGPDALETALCIGRSSCLFVVSINKAHYTAHGFEHLINRLVETGVIHELYLSEVPIYTKDSHDHSGDTAITCCFRKC